MTAAKKFPLISGHLSLDLVNTEIVKRGQRHDLLVSEEDVIEWLETMKEAASVINDELIECAKDRTTVVLSSLREFRTFLRSNFELIADQHPVTEEFIAVLEKKIEKAPFTYKFIDHHLFPSPKGEAEDVIASLISYDVLKLIDLQKLPYLKRCANPDCVLLFLDESGRRKWCSMQICGNRKKVARFQNRNIHR